MPLFFLTENDKINKDSLGSSESIGMCGLVEDFLPDEGEKSREYFVYFKIF